MIQVRDRRFARFLTFVDHVLKIGCITTLLSVIFISMLFVPILIVYSFFTKFYFLTILYLVWMVYDRHTPSRGSRRRQWFRQLKFWSYCAEYFPIRIHKTANLDPNKNYILGYHPHGIMSLGALLSGAHEGTTLSKLFPGMKFYGANLSSMYYVPILREFFLLYGAISVDRSSIEYMLTRMGQGNVVLIVIGGLRESSDTQPNTMNLTLKTRQGFVKVAIKTGASLVPCICFGENELFTIVSYSEDSLVFKLQNKLRSIYRQPICVGRGWFDGSKGPLPYRKTLNIVVGKPIDVEKCENPTQEEIDSVHQAYKDAVVKLFNENKWKYAEDVSMEIALR